MSRYILRFRGKGSMPADDVDRIRALPDTKVLDESSSRMLLVEAPENTLRTALESLPHWAICPEKTIELPDTRPKPRRAP